MNGVIVNDDLGRRHHRDLRTGSGTVQLRPAGGPIQHHERLRGEVDGLRGIISRASAAHACLQEWPCDSVFYDNL
jgi:hypothetical protein